MILEYPTHCATIGDGFLTKAFSLLEEGLLITTTSSIILTFLSQKRRKQKFCMFVFVSKMLCLLAAFKVCVFLFALAFLGNAALVALSFSGKAGMLASLYYGKAFS